MPQYTPTSSNANLLGGMHCPPSPPNNKNAIVLVEYIIGQHENGSWSRKKPRMFYAIECLSDWAFPCVMSNPRGILLHITFIVSLVETNVGEQHFLLYKIKRGDKTALWNFFHRPLLLLQHNTIMTSPLASDSGCLCKLIHRGWKVSNSTTF